MKGLYANKNVRMEIFILNIKIQIRPFDQT